MASSVCYADDVVLIAKPKKDLLLMLKDTIEAMEKVGLNIADEKTHWSSYPRLPKATLRVGAASVAREPHLKFVGSVWTSREAAERQQATAWRRPR